MPQHKSAAKRVRQDSQKRQRNRKHRSRMRTMVKKVLQSEDEAQARADYPPAQSYLDRLSTKGIIHKNQAANLKQRLTRKISDLSQ